MPLGGHFYIADNISNYSNAFAEDVPLIPDYYNEAGISDTRQDESSYSNEFIDPFTGSLQWHNTDLSIPGNGGLILSFYGHTTLH